MADKIYSAVLQNDPTICMIQLWSGWDYTSRSAVQRGFMVSYCTLNLDSLKIIKRKPQYGLIKDPRPRWRGMNTDKMHLLLFMSFMSIMIETGVKLALEQDCAFCCTLHVQTSCPDNINFTLIRVTSWKYATIEPAWYFHYLNFDEKNGKCSS